MEKKEPAHWYALLILGNLWMLLPYVRACISSVHSLWAHALSKFIIISGTCYGIFVVASFFLLRKNHKEKYKMIVGDRKILLLTFTMIALSLGITLFI